MKDVLSRLGISSINASWFTGNQEGKCDEKQTQRPIHSPIDGKQIAAVQMASVEDYQQVVAKSSEASAFWRTVPAPKRGEIVRQIGQALRLHKEDLAHLVTLEMGKLYQEALGEVQEMIDICDFAVGLSRQLHGLTMYSERPNHRMYEQWHPLGVVGIISAFNFPVAVWSWNAMIATVCGNACLWKPSEKTPLTAIACQRIVQKVIQENNLPEGLFTLVIGDRSIGKVLAGDARINLVSATGSTNMGREVAQIVGQRLGKCLLELGGNNAIIITPSADLDLAVRAVVFGAVGTAGQRCTSTRRLIVHKEIYQEVRQRLVKVYGQLTIGSPFDEGTHVGPVIDKQSVENFYTMLKSALSDGAELIAGGEEAVVEGLEGGNFIKPTIVEATNSFVSNTINRECFAPMLYLLPYEGEVEQAIAIQNDVPQGLSSAIFTKDLLESERFLSAMGSDCGIANVNIGTSGAEIGGAFGGEKDTGGGRESGSDAWKSYMRRQTNTINYSAELPLAQGIKFDV